MANDYKRMWTEEELKDTYDLVIDYDGVLYTTYDVTKEQLDNIKKHKHVRVISSSGIIYYLTKNGVDGDFTTAYSTIGDNVTQTLTLGYDEKPNYYLNINRKDLTSSEQFENLVHETPTDVSIIEDQGKLELMLEHDGNVLAINDTPNQFLQRRLGVTSNEWDKNEETLKEFLTRVKPNKYTYLEVRIGSDLYLFLYTDLAGSPSMYDYIFKPLLIYHNTNQNGERRILYKMNYSVIDQNNFTLSYINVITGKIESVSQHENNIGTFRFFRYHLWKLLVN